MFLSFNMHYFQAQARYIFPAIGPIACGFAMGTYTILIKKSAMALPLLIVVFLGVNLYALNRLPDEFSKRIARYATRPL